MRVSLCVFHYHHHYQCVCMCVFTKNHNIVSPLFNKRDHDVLSTSKWLVTIVGGFSGTDINKF